MLEEKFLVPRDMLTRNCLNGAELAVYLTLLDMFSVYDHMVMVQDDDILFGLTNITEPTKTQRKMISVAMQALFNKNVLVGNLFAGQGKYLIQCKESFAAQIDKTKYGYVILDYTKIRTLIKACPDPREWQKLIIYYYELLCHMNAEGECRYSLEYFADKINISILTLTKYNKKLVELGLIKIIKHKKSTNTYCRT